MPNSRRVTGFPLNRLTFVLLAVPLFQGCASLHHVQIGDMDNSNGQLIKFDVKESATGLNLDEARGIAKSLTKDKTVGRTADKAAGIWDSITFGPKTGEVTFNDTYPDVIPEKIAALCPSRKITGLTVIRETNKYPVISGEIVRVTGYCIHSTSNTENGQ